MAKIKAKKYIVAVKDYENTIAGLTKGTIVTETAKEDYSTLFSNIVAKCDTEDGLKKFIKFNKYKKADCQHYWEGLVELGYTLVTVEFITDDENFVENTCDREIVIYISVG